MSGNTSETRCKHCQKRIAFSGNYWLQVETNGYLSGGFCLSNPNGRHEPTPPEVEAVPEPCCEDACDAKNGIHTAMCHLRRNPAAPVVSTAAPEPPECPICGKVECMTGLPDTTPPGGMCVKHGKYICQPNTQPQCPKWPDCITAAATPVTVEAPEFPFINLAPGAIQKTLSPKECRHIAIRPTLIFEYIDGPNRQGWMCGDCGTEFKLATPKPIGDVEAVAGKLYGQLAYVDIGMVDWLKKAAAILSPFFAPAGPITIDQLYEAAKVMNSGDVRKDLYALEGLALHMHRDTGKMKYLVEALNCRVTLKDFDSKFPDPLAQPPCSESATPSDKWYMEYQAAVARAVQAEAECATLRKERDDALEWFRRDYGLPEDGDFVTVMRLIDDARGRAGDAEAQLSTLRDALRKYGNHVNCDYHHFNPPKPCNCGFSAALAPTPEVAPKE